MKKSRDTKILLLVLPFWDPLIPPQGIACLKSYLQKHHFQVYTEDGNTKIRFKSLYDKYFQLLSEFVPPDRQGNFFNIGHDVLRNHMLAHIHKDRDTGYVELVKNLVYKTFYTSLSDRQVEALNGVLDEFYSRLEDYVLELVARENPMVLGISVLRDSVAASMFAFRTVKKHHSHIKTVMGGSIFSDQLFPGSPNYEYFLERTPYIDNIIIGEGQILFLKLLQGELPLTQRVFTSEDINGESLGFHPDNVSDMSDFDINQHYHYLSAYASAGCPYQCSFCNVSIFFGKYREKDPRQAVADMEALYRQYGLQLFFMNDSLLNPVVTALSHEMLKSDLSLYWDGYLRVDEETGNRENTLLWRRGGFYRARMGVESGSQRVLDLMDKQITVKQTRESLISLASAGIKTTTYWVIGHPGETEEDFQQTLDLLEELKNHIYEAECNPFIHGFVGQHGTGRWKENQVLLYPEEAKEKLILQTWIVNAEPDREEVFRRVNRFALHCRKLGIPNPYSVNDIFKADERWARLHKNAVPYLVDFRERDTYINENKNVSPLVDLKRSLEDEGDFSF